MLERIQVPNLLPVPVATAPGAIDPSAIAAQILGVRIHLAAENRGAILQQLAARIPVRLNDAKQKFELLPLVHDSLSLSRDARPVVGEMALAVAALRSLAEHAKHLDPIGELRSCGGGSCGPDSLIALIRRSIQELVEQFESGHPIPRAVDATLQALEDFIARLKARCEIGTAPACGIEDEKVLTSFTILEGLTASFDTAWTNAKACSTEYFALKVHDAHHQLVAVVATLDRLRELVGDQDLMTAEVSPDLTAGALWRWMYDFSATTAPEMLAHGPDSQAAVHATMTEFEPLVKELIDGTAKGCGLRAFDRKKVQNVLNDLLCHIVKVKDALK